MSANGSFQISYLIRPIIVFGVCYIILRVKLPVIAFVGVLLIIASHVRTVTDKPLLNRPSSMADDQTLPLSATVKDYAFAIVPSLLILLIMTPFSWSNDFIQAFQLQLSLAVISRVAILANRFTKFVPYDAPEL